jgi:DNA-binding NarL/FixJ family response regulator
MGGHAGTYLDAHQTAEVAREDLAVVIASARPLLLLGIRGRLEGQVEVVGEATSSDDLLAVVRRDRPSILLVDAALPDALQAAVAARNALPDLAIVFLMSTDESEEGALAVEAVRSGALGVLFEDMDPGRLVPALRDVAAGGSALPRMLVPRLLDELRRPPAAA